MESETSGRVLTAASIENLEDLWAVEHGLLPAGEARRLELSDLVVDSAMTGLSLPTRLIDQLGLAPASTWQGPAAGGPRRPNRYQPVRLTIQDRAMSIDVTERSDDDAALIGQIPLGFLDLVVDHEARRLIGNPEHGGEQMFDMF